MADEHNESQQAPATGDEQAETTNQPQPDQQSENLGESGRKAIEAERRRAREADKARRDMERQLKELQDRDKSEADKLTERVNTAEARNAELEPEVLRLTVALEKGVPGALAKRLVGSTREELETDADELLAMNPATQPRQPAPDLSQASGANGGRAVSDDEAFGQLIQQKLRR